MAAVLRGTDIQRVIPGGDQAFAYEQITVANTSIGVTTATANDAIVATMRLETAEIRFRIDGGTPTTTVGTLLEPGETLEITGASSIAAFRAIRTGATSGSLSVTYQR